MLVMHLDLRRQQTFFLPRKRCGNSVLPSSSTWRSARKLNLAVNPKIMTLEQYIWLIHPALTVAIVFPIIGIALNYAWQTRQRRLESVDGGKSKIPPVVGREHVAIGRWLTGTVVGTALLGLAHPIIYKNLYQKQLWGKAPGWILMFVLAIVSLFFLYRVRKPLLRGICATLTGVGLILLGTQEGVWRLGNQWYWSHYYYGITAALLMVVSLAVVEDIYKDRTAKGWRIFHTILNTVAVLLFLGQGFTGARDLFEVALWMKPPA